MERIFTDCRPDTAQLIQLILASQALEYTVLDSKDPAAPHGRGITIMVAKADTAKARYHVEAYKKENPDSILSTDPAVRALCSPKSSRNMQFFSPAIALVILVLALIHILLKHTGLHGQAIFHFGASPYYIGQGQTFRAVTALFLHSDAGHLLGNMAGLFFLAGPLVRVTGYGSGLFCLLAAAVSGNLISNGLAMDTRLSIGASTLVMAAAGLLCTRQSLLRLKGGAKLNSLVPIVAGAVLMALFSHGERTDLSAHFFGFGAGLFTGMIFFPLHPFWHRSFMEPLFMGFTLIILGAALFSGLGALH